MVHWPWRENPHPNVANNAPFRSTRWDREIALELSACRALKGTRMGGLAYPSTDVRGQHLALLHDSEDVGGEVDRASTLDWAPVIAREPRQRSPRV
jgi:hypothetical protein